MRACPVSARSWKPFENFQLGLDRPLVAFPLARHSRHSPPTKRGSTPLRSRVAPTVRAYQRSLKGRRSASKVQAERFCSARCSTVSAMSSGLRKYESGLSPAH